MATIEKKCTACDYILTLSEDEAKTLLLIMDSIGGDPQMTRRVHTNQIGRALRDIGVTKPTGGRFFDPKADSIYFVG